MTTAKLFLTKVDPTFNPRNCPEPSFVCFTDEETYNRVQNDFNPDSLKKLTDEELENLQDGDLVYVYAHYPYAGCGWSGEALIISDSTRETIKNYQNRFYDNKSTRFYLLGRVLSNVTAHAFPKYEGNSFDHRLCKRTDMYSVNVWNNGNLAVESLCIPENDISELEAVMREQLTK